MLKRIAAGVVLAGLASISTAAPAAAWQEIGSKRVGFAVDRDSIDARGEGRFRAIRLCVEGNAIEMLDLDVVYGNGAREDIRVRERFRPGSCTRAIDLRGRDRFIRRVNMVYRSAPNFRGQAVVTLYGR